jgi:hypothetical protein|tara:strand:- start:4111 stop:4494 length:384 start_codon:yes stop_codon:yes gene_type:complete
MSFNRSKYDDCTYKNILNRNVGVLGYILDINNHEHVKPCRHQLGWLSGNNVSHIKGNVIDLESDLRNQTRYISKSTNSAYIPSNDGFIYNDKTQPINTKPLHLNGCQSISYKAISLPYDNFISNNRC